MARSTKARGNHILSALSPADRELLAPHLKARSFEVHDDLELPRKPIESVYFPESGFASIVAVSDGAERVEVGLVGREGVTGSAVILGGASSPHHTYVQAAGSAHGIGARQLREAMKASGTLATMLLRFMQVFMVQTAHTAIANARGTVEERLARWLLMGHDRIDGDDLPLTHQFIALMLGVRRAGVTESLQALEGRGMIRATRGSIIIRDRKALERKARFYYGTPEAEQRRLIG